VKNGKLDHEPSWRATPSWSQRSEFSSGPRRAAAMASTPPLLQARAEGLKALGSRWWRLVPLVPAPAVVAVGGAGLLAGGAAWCGWLAGAGQQEVGAGTGATGWRAARWRGRSGQRLWGWPGPGMSR